MNKLFTYLMAGLKPHGWTLVTALIVGWIMMLPQFLFTLELGNNYEGVYLAGTDSEEYYTARIHEVFDGHYFLGNAFLYEERDNLWLQPPLTEIFYLIIGKIFNLGSTTTILWGSRFIMPMFLFLVIYAFIFKLSENKLLANAISIFIILASQFIFLPNELINLWQFNVQAHSLDSFIIYARPVIPQISSICFFLFLLFFYLMLTKSKNGIYVYLSGLIYGLILYVYLYSWIFLTIFYGLMFIIYLFRRKRIAINILISFIFGLLLTIPYWIFFWEIVNSEFFNDAGNRYNINFTREFVGSKVLLVGIILWLGRYLYIKKTTTRFWFILVLLFSGLVAINQQIVTGRALFYGHFHWYFNVPLFIIATILSVNYFIKLINKTLSKLFLIVIICFSLVFGSLISLNSYQAKSFEYVAYQKYGPIFSELNKMGNSQLVILSNDQQLLRLIPTYTPHYIYHYDYSNLFLTDPARLKYNFFIEAWLKGIDENGAKDYFLNQKELLAGILGGARNRRLFGCRACFSDEVALAFANDYINFLQTEAYKNLAINKRVDILIWDKSASVSAPEFLAYNSEIIFSINGYEIYKLSLY